jgi:hypothetical protein
MKIARAIFDQRPSEFYAKLSVPALVVSCQTEPANERERLFQALRAEGVARVSRLAPSARVHVMKDTIHDVPVQRPQELAGLIGGFAGRLV